MASVPEDGQAWSWALPASTARRWRSVLPGNGGVRIADAVAYVSRPLTKDEASARSVLQRALVAREWWTVTVAGLAGEGAGQAQAHEGHPAEGKYVPVRDKAKEPSGSLLDVTPLVFEHADREYYIYCVGGEPARWVLCTSLDPGHGAVIAQAEARGRAPEAPWPLPPPSSRWATSSAELSSEGEKLSLSMTVTGEYVLGRCIVGRYILLDFLPAQEEDAVQQCADMRSMFEELITKRGLSIEEVQKALLPDRLFDEAFASREACFAKLGVPSIGPRGRGPIQFTGIANGLNVQAPIGHGGSLAKARSAHWIELIDGTVHVQYLPSEARCHLPMGGLKAPLDDPETLGALLRVLRWVVQRSYVHPTLHHALPARDRASVKAWTELGASFGVWTLLWQRAVLPYLRPDYRDSDVNILDSAIGKRRLFRQPPLFAKDWMGPWRDFPLLKNRKARMQAAREDCDSVEEPWVWCNVVDVEPITRSIQVDLRPGFWITIDHQARCTLKSPAAKQQQPAPGGQV